MQLASLPTWDDIHIHPNLDYEKKTDFNFKACILSGLCLKHIYASPFIYTAWTIFEMISDQRSILLMPGSAIFMARLNRHIKLMDKKDYDFLNEKVHKVLRDILGILTQAKEHRSLKEELSIARSSIPLIAGVSTIHLPDKAIVVKKKQEAKYRYGLKLLFSQLHFGYNCVERIGISKLDKVIQSFLEFYPPFKYELTSKIEQMTRTGKCSLQQYRSLKEQHLLLYGLLIFIRMKFATAEIFAPSKKYIETVFELLWGCRPDRIIPPKCYYIKEFLYAIRPLNDDMIYLLDIQHPLLGWRS